MKKLLLLMLLVSNMAFGATWHMVTTSISGDQFYVEKESITRNGNEVNYWIRVNLAKRDKSGYLSTKENYVVNCKTREQQIKYLILFSDFNNKGSIIDQFNYSKIDWRPISPDSVINTIFQYVCK